jgi:hypothetical protein
LDLNRPSGSWISHNLIGLVAVAMGLIIGQYLPGSVFLWAMIFGLAQALYFGLEREPENAKTHKAAGDWKTPGRQGVTPQADMYGDQIGNWAIGGVTVLVYLTELWAVAPMILGGLLLALLVTMKVRQMLSIGG